MAKSKKIKDWYGMAGSAVFAMILFIFWSGLAPALRGQESAPPAEDHLAVAARYRKEAEKTREAIKRHQLMIDIYSKGIGEPYMGFNSQGRERMVQHCERGIAYYTETVKELEAIAKETEVAFFGAGRCPGTLHQNDKPYVFCCEACRVRFLETPGRYAGA